jgi:hypothetical protein
MMHFIDAAIDGELLAELKDAGVLAPPVIDRTHREMGRPESGTLNDFLLAGADIIPEQPWLGWLIRRHGCHRFGRVARHGHVPSWDRESFPSDGNLPYRQSSAAALLVAVLRPDLLAATSRRLAPARLHWAAGSLRELRELRVASKKALSDRGSPAS